MAENDNGKSTAARRKENDKKASAEQPANAARVLCGPVRLDDEMKYKDLRKLETIFRESNDGEGLNMEQFRAAIKKIIGIHLDDTELDMIFMKVDSNCDGTVDWTEYLSYMHLEYQEKENMIVLNTDDPFPYPMREKRANHLESICSIALQQAFTIRNSGKIELDDSASRYITLSKDGVLNFWNVGWTLQKSTMLDGTRNDPRAVWFTDLVCMPNCNTIAVASMDYEISFYSMTSNLTQKKFQIRDMDCCALKLDYHFDYSDIRRSVLIWGDTGGNVLVLRFYDNPSLVLFSSTAPSCTEYKISLSNLVKNHIHKLRVGRFPQVHLNWVKELHYYVNSKNQEFFVSCCRNQQSAMLFADITEKLSGNADKKIELHRKSYFTVRSGVSCVAYDPELNTIATGSSDFNVRIWNPYVVNTSTMTLKGHVMPVQQICIRMVDHHVISVSKDKNIRVWDLINYTCKQSIHKRHINLGRLDVTALFFNERRLELILGTNAIGVFAGSTSLAHSSWKRSDAISHMKPITKVLYNSLFKQVVTGSEDSMISIWDVKTGAKTMQFCTERGVEITDMTFDPTYRRLITGSRNGGISVWNFNNGALLRALKKQDTLEVSAVLHAKNRIISAGWNKYATVYFDSYEDESFRRMRVRHKDDILSMDYHRLENILCTSSYDGEIFIRSLEAESFLTKLNMYESILPISGNKGKVKYNESEQRSKSSTQSVFDRNVTHLPSYLPWVEASRKAVEKCDEESNEGEYADCGIFAISQVKAINKILFLQARRSTNNTAVLLAASRSYVVAWSVLQTSGILGYFSAAKHKEETVVDMKTDDKNSLLITADSLGYLRVWKIQTYCNGADVVKRRNYKVGSLTLPNVSDADDSKKAKILRQQYSYVPMNHGPKLLASFRAHCKSITSIEFIEEASIIASGSVDCSVRLWTINGRYVGTFGQSSLWKLKLPVKELGLPVAMPNDVRRIASPTTLCTVKGGFNHQWKSVRHVVTFMSSSGEEEVGGQKPAPAENKTNVTASVEGRSLPSKNEEKVADRKKGIVALPREDNRSNSLSATLRKTNEVEALYDRIVQHGLTSNVLGRINYKPKQRLKHVDIDTTIKWIDKSPMVYSTLPWSELHQPIKVKMPECFQKRLAFQQQNSPFARCTNRLLERRKIVHPLNPAKQLSLQAMPRAPRHISTLDLASLGDAEATPSYSRVSSGSSHKTKRVSFTEA